MILIPMALFEVGMLYFGYKYLSVAGELEEEPPKKRKHHRPKFRYENGRKMVRSSKHPDVWYYL